jgi:hypothetical protein
MTTPLSINLAKAMVPMKDNIPINKITSKKFVFLSKTEKIATPEIKFIPNASSACTLSGAEGPFTNLKIVEMTAKLRKNKDKISIPWIMIVSPLL